MSSVLRMPPPTVRGRKIRAAVRGDDLENGVAVLVAGGDVEEGEFVGAGGVVDGGLFDRVTGVAEVDEVDAFDDPAVFDVQAGNDAQFQHSAKSSSASVRSMRPS